VSHIARIGPPVKHEGSHVAVNADEFDANHNVDLVWSGILARHVYERTQCAEAFKKAHRRQYPVKSELTAARVRSVEWTELSKRHKDEVVAFIRQCNEAGIDPDTVEDEKLALRLRKERPTHIAYTVYKGDWREIGRVRSHKDGIGFDVLLFDRLEEVLRQTGGGQGRRITCRALDEDRLVPSELA
jgi:hypothetical protein